MSDKILNICVSHRPPTFSVPSPYLLVAPTDAPPIETIVAPDLWNGEIYNGNVLSEYAQLFFLAKNRKDLLRFSHIHFFQYRKFVSNVASGTVAENVPYSRVTTADNAALIFQSPEQLGVSGYDFFTGPIWQMKMTAALQYGRNHHIEDLTLFVVAMRQHPFFDDKACQEFVCATQMIPSPVLGMVPTKAFFDIQAILMAVWEIYFKSFYRPRPDYQRRVGGFLLERLHSFLLLKHICQSDRHKAGYLYTVSETDHISPTI